MPEKTNPYLVFDKPWSKNFHFSRRTWTKDLDQSSKRDKRELNDFKNNHLKEHKEIISDMDESQK